MASNARLAEIAALVGDPARTAMLQALMDGRALAASELARVAGIAPQTASGHLAKLAEAGLVSVAKQGRHRYHRLASREVSEMMESIMLVASKSTPSLRKVFVGPRDAALRAGRTCYDHLAGYLGVSIADALIAAGCVELGSDGGEVTGAGMKMLDRAGIEFGAGDRRRIFCRPCLDWSERRPHLAGVVGAAICTHCFAKGWIRRVQGTRAVAVTPKGQRGFRETFGIRLS
jgi:DNA-binding transcriptional ArsR family regulator